MAIGVMACLAGCAQISSPTGGPLDTEPPVALEFTPPSEMANVRPSTLTIAFNEFVKMKSLGAQLLISPPLKRKPSFRLRGKMLTLDLDTSLFVDNATYVFQFGEGIVDLNEGNPAKNLVWAFSTGPELDTLRVVGKTLDRTTREALDGMRVMLHFSDTPIDSVLAGVLPVSVGTSDSQGRFSLPYLRAGDYRLWAVDDANGDYRWQLGESLGLSEDLVSAGDSIADPILVDETEGDLSTIRYIAGAKLDSTGLIRIFAPGLDSGELDPFQDWELTGLDLEQSSTSGDSAWIWAQPFANGTWPDSASIIWPAVDTFKLRLPPRPSPENGFAVTTSVGGKERANDPREWTSDRPWTRVDPGKIGLEATARDTTWIIDAQWSMTNRELTGEWTEEPDTRYTLTVLPGGWTQRGASPLTGYGHTDTLAYSWSTWPQNHFGTFTLAVSAAPLPGWVELRDGRNNVLDLRDFPAQRDTTFAWPGLLPGSHSLHWRVDSDGNGIWDGVRPGSWRAPEPTYPIGGELEIRSNWEVQWDWSPTFAL
jgi:hypothetical protein